MTEDQTELANEAEVDDLLEFAYELDYEKYMEDVEVRQALAIIKDRVNNMKKDNDWKEKITDEWNQANENPNAPDDNRSQVSYSKHSYVLISIQNPLHPNSP